MTEEDLHVAIFRTKQYHEPLVQVWLQRDGRLYYYGPGDLPPSHRGPINPEETLPHAIERLKDVIGWSLDEVASMAVAPGTYHPRIYRPYISRPDLPNEARDQPIMPMDELMIQAQQVSTLALRLTDICRTVHPAGTNLQSFGQEIRSLIILCATEVEAMWKGVLRSNGVEKERTTTNDYVKLKTAMRLDEYAVRFLHYPWLPPFSPFNGWSSVPSPTDSLPWYADYHAIKHDREAEFHRATLQRAFECVAACATMLAAQGDHELLEAGLAVSRPMWPVAEKYVWLRDRPFKAANFPF